MNILLLTFHKKEKKKFLDFHSFFYLKDFQDDVEVDNSKLGSEKQDTVPTLKPNTIVNIYSFFYWPTKDNFVEKTARALQLDNYEPDSLCLGPLLVKRTCLPKEDLFVYVWEHVINFCYFLFLEIET